MRDGEHFDVQQSGWKFAVQVIPLAVDFFKTTDFMHANGPAGLTVTSDKFDDGSIVVLLLVPPYFEP